MTDFVVAVQIAIIPSFSKLIALFFKAFFDLFQDEVLISKKNQECHFRIAKTYTSPRQQSKDFELDFETIRSKRLLY
jgi:hypothetical protein